MLEAGSLLKRRYRIDKQIGLGGMGAVYVATDQQTGEEVAIKETLCMDENFRKAIEREARLLDRLSHPALPKVSDHFEEADSQFIVMEYIPGDDIATMLEHQKRSFPLERVLAWADQLLDALNYLHDQEQPVIHRDIKPQNLKIGPDGRMVLLDFGLAKGNPTDASHQTAAKSIFGYSRNYASLEQIQGTGTDPRSDLYSLAATLYHLLTGVPPEDALTRAMDVLAKRRDPMKSASQIDTTIPNGVAEVLLKAMDLDAAERPATAAEMREMLREHDKYSQVAEVDNWPPAERLASGAVTQVATDATVAGTLAGNDAKTKLMPSGDAPSTNQRTLGEEDAEAKGRGIAAAAGAFVTLAVLGGAALSVYVINPSVFDAGNTDREASVQSVNNSRGSNADAVASVASPEPQETNNAKEQVKTVADPKVENAGKAVQTEQPRPPLAKKKVDIGEGTVVEFSDPDEPGSMTVTTVGPDGVKRTMKINPRPSNMGPPPQAFDPFPKGFDASGLTPEQARRLRAVIRENMVRRPPVPPRTQVPEPSNVATPKATP